MKGFFTIEICITLAVISTMVLILAQLHSKLCTDFVQMRALIYMTDAARSIQAGNSTLGKCPCGSDACSSPAMYTIPLNYPSMPEASLSMVRFSCCNTCYTSAVGLVWK